jgi:hypothetical protein
MLSVVVEVAVDSSYLILNAKKAPVKYWGLKYLKIIQEGDQAAPGLPKSPRGSDQP